MLPPDPERRAIREKCVEIDNAITRYTRVQGLVVDDQATETANQLIAELEPEKAALHPE